MDNQQHKQPMPKNGQKVNDWETLRPYVEEAAPPTAEDIAESISGKTAKLNPKWGFGYSAEIPTEDLPGDSHMDE